MADPGPFPRVLFARLKRRFVTPQPISAAALKRGDKLIFGQGDIVHRLPPTGIPQMNPELTWMVGVF